MGNDGKVGAAVRPKGQRRGDAQRATGADLEGEARQRDDRPVRARLLEKGQAKLAAHGYERHLLPLQL